MVNFDMHKVRKMTINCEPFQVSEMTKLLKVRKMANLKIYLSPSIKKVETFEARTQSQRHSKGSIEYSASGDSDVITS